MREGESVGMTRRSFLMSGGVAVTLLLPELSAFAQPGGAVVELMEYPMKKVARLSELKEGQPLGFTYPLEKQPNFLVKLGAPAQAVWDQRAMSSPSARFAPTWGAVFAGAIVTT